METIKLADTARTTTRLGFGCGALGSGVSRSASLRLLHAAFEAGIRHFDVAPMYGLGAAESILGEFLHGRRDEVTVATKFGIAAPKHGGMLRAARRVAAPILQALPAVKRRLARPVGRVVAPAEKGEFSAVEARESLELSLRALGTEHLDVWFLHEATVADLYDEALLRFLEDCVREGKVGTFGPASEAREVSALLLHRPAYCRCLQYEWSVLDPAIGETKEFRFHHRSLTEPLRQMQVALHRDPAKRKGWSEAIGQDLDRREVLAGLMLKAALEMNPESVILFSSRDAQHVRENVRVAEDAALAAPARRLHALVQQQGIAEAAGTGKVEG